MLTVTPARIERAERASGLAQMTGYFIAEETRTVSKCESGRRRWFTVKETLELSTEQLRDGYWSDAAVEVISRATTERLHQIQCVCTGNCGQKVFNITTAPPSMEASEGFSEQAFMRIEESFAWEQALEEEYVVGDCWVLQHTPGCSKCRYSPRGCRACHPSGLPYRDRPEEMQQEDDARAEQVIVMGKRTPITAVPLVRALEKKGHTATEFVSYFTELIYRLGGPPSELVLDRDPLFTSAEAEQAFSNLRIKPLYSSGGWSRTNGAAERANQHIEMLLRLFTSHYPDKWDSWLITLEHVVKTTVSVTGWTPQYLTSGVRATPLHEVIERAVQSAQQEAPSVYDHLARIAEAWKTAAKALERVRDDYVRYYSKRKIRVIEYSSGQRVWLSRDAIRGLVVNKEQHEKLGPRWFGPFEIEEVYGQKAVKLKLPPRMRCHPTFNVVFVRPAAESKRFPVKPHRPAPALEVGQFGGPEWRIGHIMDRQTRRHGQVYYKVHWKGYGPEEDSWEPAYRLREDVPGLLDRFDAQLERGAKQQRAAAEKRRNAR